MTQKEKEKMQLIMQNLITSVGSFIRQSPAFDGDCVLASEIGTLMGTLQGKIENLPITSLE